MTVLRPGKGAHLDLTEETLDFFHNVFTDLWNAAGDGTAEDNPTLDTLIDSGEGMQYLKDVSAPATHWVKSKDNFGTKLHKALPWGDGGEIRVTVVLNTRGELKIDMRYWFDPDSSTTPSWKQ